MLIFLLPIVMARAKAHEVRAGHGRMGLCPLRHDEGVRHGSRIAAGSARWSVGEAPVRITCSSNYGLV
ncbi:hypothetical protein Q5530_16745 [Saccharothrix sp. BKS2]|uniref:hypothetical protein n=1 Tax=Saccharothrix sp. BKS2 TaxID=3064400 RepID=UPI0039EC606F